MDLWQQGLRGTTASAKLVESSAVGLQSLGRSYMHGIKSSENEGFIVTRMMAIAN